jgi:hypothetical protein
MLTGKREDPPDVDDSRGDLSRYDSGGNGVNGNRRKKFGYELLLIRGVPSYGLGL